MHHTNPSPQLRGAFQAIDRGWHVFPLLPGQKRPAVSSWETRATVDQERARRCWSTGGYNVGIAAGPSRLVIVDLDTPKHDQDLPPTGTPAGVKDGQDALAVLAEQAGQPYPGQTHTIRTGCGLHLYFAALPGVELRNSAAALGWKIDTRACGGYVVGAGSTVNGKQYTVIRDEAPAPLPAWLAKLLTPTPRPPEVPVAATLSSMDHHSAYLKAAVVGELARVTRAPSGSRNNALYLASVALGQLVAGGELSASEVTGWLTRAALAIGLAEWEARRSVASGLRAGAKRPRTVAARRSGA
ncbi:hypothetical protein P3T36_004685 [Kitasatospora sp. MAP12-15]|uniref:bifunctional DNA primase/polymerase n=1 Tax=unclassified Kitasatospora TaxID=2633591 RepID=UPI002474EA1A|nr:bifunctional DNA primase/polymerase [Kitasatospora sp. MAP12-44]MDH6111531.1 hypothetical protein [Kitasatospora sp. MAP12-44]